MTPRILSVSIGSVAPLFVRDGSNRPSTVMSAIRKSPVSSLDNPVDLQVVPMGIAGDETADPTVHGGREKAVYLMPSEHYAFWQAQRLRAGLPEDPLPHGFLGENLTIENLLEHEVFIGDELLIGDVRLAVTQPREPCFKFTTRLGYAHAAKHMVQQGNCGWYARVIHGGTIRAGQVIERVAGPQRTSVTQQFAWLNRRGQASLF